MWKFEVTWRNYENLLSKPFTRTDISQKWSNGVLLLSKGNRYIRAFSFRYETDRCLCLRGDYGNVRARFANRRETTDSKRDSLDRSAIPPAAKSPRIMLVYIDGLAVLCGGFFSRVTRRERWATRGCGYQQLPTFA